MDFEKVIAGIFSYGADPDFEQIHQDLVLLSLLRLNFQPIFAWSF